MCFVLVDAINRLTNAMNEYRITKYNPEKRNEFGHYTHSQEWTSFSEIGKNVSLEEYLAVECAYIKSAIEFLQYSNVCSLRVSGLEDSSHQSHVQEGEIIPIEHLEPVLRALLREEFWCRLEAVDGFIHVGWDYYMYVGVIKGDELAISKATNRGLFVEDFVSPYHARD